MEDDFMNEYKSISNRVNQVIKEADEMRKAKRSARPANKVVRPTNNGPRPVVNAPRATATLKPRNRTFYDLVQKSRTLDQRIKQSRKAGKDVKDRIQDLEEFSKISEEMEKID